MEKYKFDQLMALWLKGKKFSCETNADGNVVIWPDNAKEKISAIIDPEKGEAVYWMDFSDPVVGTYIPVVELDDLRHFVDLLIGSDE